MKKVELTNIECELIKEALINNSVKYAYDSNVMREKEPEWSKMMMKKSNDMTKLLNKLNGVVEMKEILTMGNVTKDFKRLGVTVRQTYKSDEYGVCEVTDEEFKILCDEPDIDGTWEDGGWRYCEGSNQIEPGSEILINNKVILAWYDYDEDFENEKEKQEYLKENNGVMELEKYNKLLEYLCDHMGCSQPRNVCALTKDLAKYNNMKLSELFKRYQG